MPPSGRREREREDTRRRITDAARRLFTAEGYANVTMRRIAEAVEYTPGAIYSYFEDKDAILYELHVQGFEELGRRMRSALDGVVDPIERLRRIGTAYTTFAQDNPELYDLMFVAQATHRAMDEDSWPEGTRVYDFVRTEVQTALGTGHLRAGDPEAIAFLLWSAVHGMVTLEVRGRTKVIAEADRARVAELGYQYLIETIANPASARPKATPPPAARRSRPARRPRRSLPEA
jgi:AcrR family transcriptional regulator